MNCNEARQHWDLYHDSEGDSELHFQINEHLGNCPACAEWFSKQSRLEGLLEEKLAGCPASPEIWNSILQHTELKSSSSVKSWFWFVGVAACIGLVFLFVSHLPIWNAPKDSSDLSHLTAQWHESFVHGKETVAFRSTSDLQVEEYLKDKVTFPVRCPPRKDAGFAVEGAGVCDLDNHPAAYLVGKVQSSQVSIFVLPKTCLPHFPHQQEAVRYVKQHHCRQGQFRMVMGIIDQNVVVVIGQSSPQQLESVLNAYGTYPHADG